MPILKKKSQTVVNVMYIIRYDKEQLQEHSHILYDYSFDVWERRLTSFDFYGQNRESFVTTPDFLFA